MTVLEDIYEKYESFRNSPTAKEHANLFIAWMLTRKEELIEKEKQHIIDALQHETPFLTIKSGNYTADEFEYALRKIQDDYYESLKIK